MSNFNWEKAHYLYSDCDLIADLATEGETIRAMFGAETFDGEIKAEFVIEIGNDSYSTNNTADWPMIERFIPPLGVAGGNLRGPARAEGPHAGCGGPEGYR